MADDFEKVSEDEFRAFTVARWERTGVKLIGSGDHMAGKTFYRDPTITATSISRDSPDVIAYIESEYGDKEFYIRRAENRSGNS